MTTGVRAAAGASRAPPPALLDEVDGRCRALAATAVGRVYSVPARGAAEALRSEARTGACYNTILSFMCTPHVASLEDYIAAIEQVLADEGWIGMVEPAWLERGALREWLTARRRHPLPRRSANGRDLATAVRSCGLVVTDIHRREARSVPPAWRQYVVLKARRESPRSPEP
ncbi:MAG: hypothetical protein J4F50_01355 [Acidimicrobiia bacterium]|nr:hypothetical protein [Acidimicrobiia bacterium]